MCGYITYEQYKALGGTASSSAFPRLEQLSRKKLVLIIDAMERIKSGFVNVASTSNDGLTVNYASARTEEQMMGSVYDQIVEILPVELVSLEVGI